MSPEKLAQKGYKWFVDFPPKHIPFIRKIGNPRIDQGSLLFLCPVILSGKMNEDEALNRLLAFREEWNPRKTDFSFPTMGAALRHGIDGERAATVYAIACAGFSNRPGDKYPSAGDLASAVIAAGKASNPKGLSEAVGAVRDLFEKYRKETYDSTNTYPQQAASVMAAVEYVFHTPAAELKADMNYYLNNAGFTDRYEYLKTPKFSYLGQRIAALLAYAQRDSGFSREKIAAMYRGLFGLDGYPLSAAELVVSICGAAVVERDLKKPDKGVTPKPEGEKSGSGGRGTVISFVGSGISAAAASGPRTSERPNPRSLARYSGSRRPTQFRG